MIGENLVGVKGACSGLGTMEQQKNNILHFLTEEFHCNIFRNRKCLPSSDEQH